MNRVLLTTDLSEESVRVIKYAKRHVLSGSEHISLVCVIDSTPNPMWPESFDLPPETELIAEVRNKLDHLCQIKLHGFLVTSTIAASGNIAEWLCHQASREGCDAIIMGSHGSGAFTNLFLGSTLQRVLRLAKCPVIVIPKQAITP